MLHLKTDDELRFFVANPAYYQAELVQAARQELRRRHPPTAPPAAPAPPLPLPVAATRPAAPEEAPATVPYAAPEAAPPERTPWVVPASIAAVLLLAGLGFWHKAGQPRPRPVKATPAAAAAPAPAAARVPPQLETVEAPPPLPTFATASLAEQALAQVPAAEKTNAQYVDQYRVISGLFWTAQQPSAYLIAQAQQGTPNPVFESQARQVLSMWFDFERTLVYSYHFGPVMRDHLERMTLIAKQQRAALTALAGAAASQQPLRLTDAQLVAGQQALPRLLAPLQPPARK